MKRWVILIAIIAGIALAAVLAKRGGSANAVEVRMATVERQDIRASVLTSGTINYRDQVTLRPEITGGISEILVEEGEAISVDQILLRIDPELFEADVAQNEANVRMQRIGIERQRILAEHLNKKLLRQRSLFEKGMIGQDNYDAVENEARLAQVDLQSRRESLKQAQAQLSQARDRLKKTTIRSPINGIVTSLDVKVGETVVAGTTNIIGSQLMSLADPESIVSEVQVDEADILQVEIGQQAEVTAVSAPDQPITGKVETIAITAKKPQGKNSLSFLVRLQLDSADIELIRPGINCRAEIYTTAAEKAVAVPIEAVLYEEAEDTEEEQAYVYVVDNNTAQKRPVTTGLQNDTLIEITDGLKEGAKIATGPLRMLRSLSDNAAVKAVDEDGQST